MERTYSDSELEAMKPENRPKIMFDGKEYDDYSAQQMQRRIEASIRRWKRREAGAMNDEDATAAKARLRRLNKLYKNFSKAAGLPTQPERIKILYAS